MTISRSKRAANNKWDKENMKIVACKLRKEQAERFSQYAKDNGTTVNSLLKNFILEKIGDRTNEFELVQLKPHFVLIFDDNLIISDDNVVIPVKIKNIGNGTAVGISIILDDDCCIKSSCPNLKHSMYRYLSQHHAQKNECVSFSFVCNGKTPGCNLYFSISFRDMVGTIYRQDFRMLYSSTFNNDHGVITENYSFEDPICVEE